VPCPGRSFAGPVDKGEGRLILQRTMLLKSVICSAAVAFATTALLPTGVAVAGRGGVPMEGTWNWPPYAGSEGGMPGKTTCGYVRTNPYPYKRREPGRSVYECR
jgi:hypothetical protein